MSNSAGLSNLNEVPSLNDVSLTGKVEEVVKEKKGIEKVKFVKLTTTEHKQLLVKLDSITSIYEVSSNACEVVYDSQRVVINMSYLDLLDLLRSAYLFD